MCLLHQQNPFLTYKELEQKFNDIAKNTVCNILKNKEKWLEVNNSDANKQKDRSPKFL